MDFSRVSGGIFTADLVRALIHANHIFGAFPDTITDIFLPLTATTEIYRVPHALVPQKGERIRALLKRVSALHMPSESPLEEGCSYLVRLRETLVLPPAVTARFSSKDKNFDVTLLADSTPFLNEVSFGYTGELWASLIPKQGPLIFAGNAPLGSLCFFTTCVPIAIGEALRRHHEEGIFFDREANSILPLLHEERGIVLTLHAAETRDLTSAECIRLPHDYTARVTHGSRTTYLPPGFGNAESPAGLPLSFEISPREVVLLQPGQPLCALSLLPVAREGEIEPALYTQPPPSNAKTE